MNIDVKLKVVSKTDDKHLTVANMHEGGVVTVEGINFQSKKLKQVVTYILNSKRNVVILNRRHNSTTRVLHVSFSGNMQSNIILNHDCA